ncbi:hypothetical protein HELRODRAFT_177417 [Helobdella robusta]|uniref:C2 domain-containing protein n=1 Tax=Helobdella robusta TaxID=6412 RepID=T1FBN4_HELRO|nr:hypothetical protein HELRODRAFT_177417 [Helobdella robusta]ESN98172.1 hypothetical protein HELRODRAFT_177417 [Helobdella robusta]
MFEVKATLPRDKDLIVRVRDYDLIGSDDTIGETIVDLENRFLTKCRATVGLPQSYCTTGICKWRDSKLPSEILEDFCSNRMKGVAPVYANDERLALHVLNTLPSEYCGYPLVVEHVETRPLFNTLQPGIEQGKIQMWVDIFPILLGPPGPPVDISARKPKNYELRIVIWNTKDVILEETSITGEKMSDIYVKGWIGNPEEKQETDVHYRSLDGEGNFNWRFVFPFQYIPAEQCLVIHEKEHFWSLDKTEHRLPPMLTIQIWDNDKFSKDDFLGSLELNLNSMPNPTKSSSKCTLEQLPQFHKSGNPVKLISLFENKRVKGFWPCFSDESGQADLTGKVEMELELVCGGDIEQKPVGKAREDPNQFPFLDPPKRPETSFFWFTSPWKAFKFIIWKKFKWYFITILVVFFIGLFLFLFFYALPGAAARRIVGG